MKRLHALLEKPEHDATQNISRSRRRQGRGRVGLDDRLPIRRRDHRIASLQDEDSATAARSRTRARSHPQTIGLSPLANTEQRRLAVHHI